MPTIVRTERLLLTPCPPEVARAAVERGAAGAARLLGVRVDPSWPPADLLEVLPGYVDVVEIAPAWATWGVWLIFDADRTELLGDVGFKGPPDSDGRIELGYGVVERHRRRGYATEAVRALAAWAFRQPGVAVLQARCLTSNVASQGVLKNAGFRWVGTDDGIQDWERGPREEGEGAAAD